MFWQAGLARLTLGISPAGVSGAFYSWISHMAQAPGKVTEVAAYPFLHTHDFIHRMTCNREEGCAIDPRFKSEQWSTWPWRFYAESFLQMEDWWRKATTDVPGMSDHAERVVSFAARQFVDALCPANFPLTNPVLFYETLNSGGQNLANGAHNAYVDTQRLITGEAAVGDEKFILGKNLAVTPGEVIFRNDLIELIRYTPVTKEVYAEPVLIIPAWIMKYYILDLSPHNSLVRWLVEQGHTVYMVSWKNPGWEDRNLSMDDYYRLGAMAAIDFATKEFPDTKIHLTGYCLGGTLAMITAAAMARDGDNRLKSLTLFAAQGDFTEAGELELFVTPSEVSFLKNVMEVQGYLDPKQMVGAFQMLRSYDLIWSKMINDYLEGRRRDTFDLTFWNADTTRMPSRMHGEYLEKLFLHNDFAQGRYLVEGRPVAPENITVPVFAVSTEKDHIAPWHSVYKIHLMVNGGITFVLTVGGHNAGIVSEPGHKGRYFHVHERKENEAYMSPSRWLAMAKKQDGSWWISWHEWLRQYSAKGMRPPPAFKNMLGAAPGMYIFQK